LAAELLTLDFKSAKAPQQNLLMRRRDLSAGQKAMIGLEIAPHLEAAAKERQIEGGKRGKEGGRGKRKTPVLDRGQPKRKRAPRVVDQIAKTTSRRTSEAYARDHLSRCR
jgi:hypothetical protein